MRHPSLKSEFFFQHVMDNLPANIYWKDLDGKFFGCNLNQAKVLNCQSVSDVIGKTDLDFYPLEHAKKVQENDKIVICGKKLLTIKEFVELPNGEKKLFLSKKIPLIDHETQNTLGVMGISIDITDLSSQSNHSTSTDELFMAELAAKITGTLPHPEQSVQESAYQLRDFFENIIAIMPGHVYWQDRNNIFLGCNDLQAKHANLTSRHDIIGKSNFDMPWKDQAEALNCINKQVMSTGKPVIAEEYAVMQNGPAVYLSHKVPLKDKNDTIIGILGISMDITDRKRMENELKKSKEKAETALQAKNRFIANMSHDIRTPLSGIIGLSEILSTKLRDPDLQQLNKNILISGKQLAKLLNQILEISSNPTDEQAGTYSTCDIRAMLENILDLFKANAQKKTISLKSNIDKEIPDHIKIDSINLHRIILNLVSNALKFTNEGSVEIDCSLKTSPNQCQMIEVAIKDTGIGIDPSDYHSIFEPFVKLHPSYEGLYEGNGLGLHFCKTWIKKLEGHIWVEPNIPHGSIFKISFPLSVPDPDEKSNENQHNDIYNNLRASLTSHKILLVEDNPICQQATAIMLLEEGQHVTAVSSAKEALKTLETDSFDVILLDIGLPDMDGLELAKLIRKNKNCTAIPIFAITAHLENDQLQLNYSDAGIDAVMTKPFNFKTYESLIFRHLIK